MCEKYKYNIIFCAPTGRVHHIAQKRRQTDVSRLTEPNDLRKGLITRVDEGPHGPYFHAKRLSDEAHVTVSRKAWQGDWPPERGLYVMLGQISGKPAGLRADFCRLWRESDG
jgi:hypothetical protein